MLDTHEHALLEVDLNSKTSAAKCTIQLRIKIWGRWRNDFNWAMRKVAHCKTKSLFNKLVEKRYGKLSAHWFECCFVSHALFEHEFTKVNFSREDEVWRVDGYCIDNCWFFCYMTHQMYNTHVMTFRWSQILCSVKWLQHLLYDYKCSGKPSKISYIPQFFCIFIIKEIKFLSFHYICIIQ